MMTEEGKFARAMSMAGEAGRLAPSASDTERPAERSPGPTHRRAEPPETRGAVGAPTTPETLVLATQPFGEAASQVRAARAKIVAMNRRNEPWIVTVTSAMRREGKTTTAMNLAAAFAEIADGRVLLIDGDVLNPSCHHMFDFHPETGLHELLEDGAADDSHVYRTPVPNLDLVPAMSAEEHDGFEGLIAQRCAALFAALRRRYAYTVIDTPPVLAGSPASTLARHSDGTILVARLERTAREVVRRAADELTHAGGRIIGCILTHRKNHIPDFIYRYFGSPPHHYYGYYRRARRNGKNGKPSAAEKNGNNGKGSEGPADE